MSEHEIEPPAAEPARMYRVLSAENPDASAGPEISWLDHGEWQADNPEAAITAAIERADSVDTPALTYVAVSTRHWQPKVPRVEQTTKITFG